MDRDANNKNVSTDVNNLKNIDKATQNMKTDRAKHDRLAKEKVNAKADLQRKINALDAQFNDLQSNRRKNWEQSQKKRTLLENKSTPHGSEKTSLHQLDEFHDVSLENLVEEENDNIIELDETSLKDFNVQELNVKDFKVRTDEKQNDWNPALST